LLGGCVELKESGDRLRVCVQLTEKGRLKPFAELKEKLDLMSIRYPPSRKCCLLLFLMTSFPTTTKSSRVDPPSLCNINNPPTQYKYELEVDYPRSEWAQYVANALVVDKELKPKMITKTITVVNEKTLKVYD
jgi:hypothetical protein